VEIQLFVWEKIVPVGTLIPGVAVGAGVAVCAAMGATITIMSSANTAIEAKRSRVR
jgi:hypothetical protein